MPKPGPRTTYRYSPEFKATAVRLSQLPGVSVSDVAEWLYIHPFMLSRWRRLAREGRIMIKGVGADPAVAAELKELRRVKKRYERKLPRQADTSKVELPAVSCWRYLAGVRSPKLSWGRSSLYSIIHQ